MFLSPTGILGGAEMCLLDLLASFRGDRPEWSLKVLLGDDGPLRRAIADLDVACEVIPLPGRLAALGDAGLDPAGARWKSKLALATAAPEALRYLQTLKRRLRAEAPSLVQTNGMKAHLLGAWAAPRGVPVVWHLHDYLGSRPLMSKLLALSARRGVRGVAVSPSVAADVSRVLGERVSIASIDNAADLERFAPGPEEGPWLDALAGFPPARSELVRVGLVATYARWKGHEVFLDALARLPDHLSARYLIVGGPLYRSAGSQYSTSELAAAIEARGLTDRVRLAGHQAEPERVYRGLDVVVHASTRPEPFGRVIVEAMACGRAVVVSKTGGASDLFEDGISALGCPPGDPVALAETLSRLIEDAPLRRRLGDAGRLACQRRFDRRGLAAAWEKVYAGAGLEGLSVENGKKSGIDVTAQETRRDDS